MAIRPYGISVRSVGFVARHDMEIGENAVVEACAWVNKSRPASKTAVGIPCKVID